MRTVSMSPRKPVICLIYECRYDMMSLMQCIYFIFTFVDCAIVKPVYKGHSREPENVSFMGSCPLHTG